MCATSEHKYGHIWTRINIHTLSRTHSFSSKYLVNTYNIPGNGLVAKNTAMSKIDNILQGGYIPEGVKGIWGMEKNGDCTTANKATAKVTVLKLLI